MVPFWTQILQRPPAHPFGLGLRLRQDDLVKHGFVPFYHDAVSARQRKFGGRTPAHVATYWFSVNTRRTRVIPAARGKASHYAGPSHVSRSFSNTPLLRNRHRYRCRKDACRRRAGPGVAQQRFAADDREDHANGDRPTRRRRRATGGELSGNAMARTRSIFPRPPTHGPRRSTQA